MSLPPPPPVSVSDIPLLKALIFNLFFISFYCIGFYAAARMLAAGRREQAELMRQWIVGERAGVEIAPGVVVLGDRVGGLRRVGEDGEAQEGDEEVDVNE